LGSFLPENILPGPAPAAGPTTGAAATTNVSASPGLGATTPGDLLGKSSSASAVDVQRRTPLDVDPRIRGYHVGEVLSFADWGFWTPARIDLDTALGKINPDNIYNIAVINGPYNVRFGPGFAFLDIQTLPTPRYDGDGFEAHGITSIMYRSNGEALAGRQYIMGGGSDWGFRIGYNILAGGDYTDGGGATLPTRYNSQNVDFAIGFDLTADSRLEIKYLRQMQNDVQFPGLLTDLTQLNTDGVSVRYLVEKSACFDRLTLDAWYNNTSFTGDSNQPGKRVQIPQLNGILTPTSPDGQNQAFLSQFNNIRLDVNTSDYQSSWGFREAMTWGADKGVQLTIGVDFTVQQQQYNEFDSLDFLAPSNLGIPAARSFDPGLFVDGQVPIGDCWLLRAGMRFDLVTTELLHLGPDADPVDYAQTVGGVPGSSEQYFLCAAFGTAEYKLTDELTMTGGYGFAERPPMLTELYTGGAFFGLIQNGFNSIFGNPDLKPEQLQQLDLGIKANYTRFRGGASGYFAFVHDYITYQSQGPFTFDISPQFNDLQTVFNQYRYKNTGLATLAGFELYGEYDWYCWLTPFVTMGYVDGRDQTISEPLPGIAPLETRLGLRIHDPDKQPRWAVELLARVVDTQDRFAESLLEQRTGGFTVFNVRGFWQLCDNVLLTAGVENFTDRNYQEHLDLRTGLGVYQPGINFYTGLRINY